jgi:hypothetical protein
MRVTTSPILLAASWSVRERPVGHVVFERLHRLRVAQHFLWCLLFSHPNSRTEHVAMPAARRFVGQNLGVPVKGRLSLSIRPIATNAMRPYSAGAASIASGS